MKATGQPAQTGGFITGADAIDAIAYAIKKCGRLDRTGRRSPRCSRT